MQPVALPDGIIGVLSGQRRQQIAMTVEDSAVEGAQFVHQHTDGPAVSHDVMLGEQQHMLFVCQLQQLTADQRALGKVERRLCFKGGEFGNTMGVRRRLQRTQILTGQGKADIGGINVLAGLSVDQDKAGAQALLPGNQAIECGDQGVAVKLAGKTQRYRDMVGQAGGGIELTKEPQPLLGERQW